MIEKKNTYMPLGLFHRNCKMELPSSLIPIHDETKVLLASLEEAKKSLRELQRKQRTALPSSMGEIADQIRRVEEDIEATEDELRAVKTRITQISPDDAKVALDGLQDRFQSGNFRYRTVQSYPRGYILYEKTDEVTVKTISDLVSHNDVKGSGIVLVKSPDEFETLTFGYNGDLLESYDPSKSDADKDFIRKEIYAFSEFIKLVFNKEFVSKNRLLFDAYAAKENAKRLDSDTKRRLFLLGIETFLGKDKDGNPIGVANVENRRNWLAKSNTNWQGKAIDCIRGYIVTELEIETGLKEVGKKNNFPNEEYRRLLNLRRSLNGSAMHEYVGVFEKSHSREFNSYQNNKYKKITGGSLIYNLWLDIKRDLTYQRKSMGEWSSYSQLASAVLVIGFDLFMYMKETLQVPRDFMGKPFYERLNSAFATFKAEHGYHIDVESWRRKHEKFMIRRFSLSHVVNPDNLATLLVRLPTLDVLCEDDLKRIETLFLHQTRKNEALSDEIHDNLANDGFGVNRKILKVHQVLYQDLVAEDHSRIASAVPFAIDKPLEQIAVLTDLEPPTDDFEASLAWEDSEGRKAEILAENEKRLRKQLLKHFRESEVDDYIVLWKEQYLPSLDQRKADRKQPANRLKNLRNSGWRKLIDFLSRTFTPLEALSVDAKRDIGLSSSDAKTANHRTVRKAQELTDVFLSDLSVGVVPQERDLREEDVELSAKQVPDFLSRLRNDEKAALFSEMAWELHVMDDNEFMEYQTRYQELTEFGKKQVLRGAYAKIVRNVLRNQ